MFKALNLQSDTELILLQPAWLEQIPLLRSLTAQDQLVCPICRTALRLRAGRYRRAHFAHKHHANCPYQNESPLLLSCRVVLYEWLVSQFDPQRVNVEQHLDDTALLRPLDACVTGGAQTFAYWIIERRMPPLEREALGRAALHAGMIFHWIFTTQVLNPGRSPDSLSLSTTEWEFMSRSMYDDIQLSNPDLSGKSLHYLDPDTPSLVTYRGLRLVHSPQRYRGHPECHPLSQVSASPLNGEPVHPGETERLEVTRQRRAAYESTLQHAGSRFKRYQAEYQDAVPSPDLGDSLPAREPFNQVEALCMYCGQLTSEWWYLDPAGGKCKCRDCLRKGLG